MMFNCRRRWSPLITRKTTYGQRVRELVFWCQHTWFGSWWLLIPRTGVPALPELSHSPLRTSFLAPRNGLSSFRRSWECVVGSWLLSRTSFPLPLKTELCSNSWISQLFEAPETMEEVCFALRKFPISRRKCGKAVSTHEVGIQKKRNMVEPSIWTHIRERNRWFWAWPLRPCSRRAERTRHGRDEKQKRETKWTLQSMLSTFTLLEQTPWVSSCTEPPPSHHRQCSKIRWDVVVPLDHTTVAYNTLLVLGKLSGTTFPATTECSASIRRKSSENWHSYRVVSLGSAGDVVSVVIQSSVATFHFGISNHDISTNNRPTRFWRYRAEDDVSVWEFENVLHIIFRNRLRFVT